MTDDRQALLSIDDRREEIIALLSERFAQDVIPMDEFERRVEAAHDADSLAALASLVADLTTTKPGPRSPSVEVTETALVPQAERSLQGEQPERGFVMALFSASERKGGWTVPKKMRAVAVMGATKVDYREAKFGLGVHELTVFACMGGVDIVVPPNVTVECSGMGILGGFDSPVNDGPVNDGPAAHADRPVLRINGVALMGGVGLRMRLPGESNRDARKRRKRELKEKKQRLLSD